MNHNRQGAIGAILDEYSKAIIELQEVIKNITPSDLTTIVDQTTQNPDCKSIQTILTHVVGSGYSYSIYIQELKNSSARIRQKNTRESASDYIDDLNSVLAFTFETFSDFEDHEFEEFEVVKKIKTSWGQIYDIEQIMEHAIVHILRHRRQIEKFKLLVQYK
ncbi:MAG: DinB family protein [Flavobacterium sp.]